MSIDRRIVSILYHNEIFDIEDVEKFIGENDNYYEVIIDNELKKLKIPGYKYDINTENEEKTKIQRAEIAETLLHIVNEDNIPYFSEEWVKEKILIIESENSFEEEMKKSDDENAAFLEKIKEDEVKEIFKQPSLEEMIKEVKENKKLVATKVEIKSNTKTTKKPKNVVIKKTDDDIDDFMNTI
jgi:hypothetical protein